MFRQAFKKKGYKILYTTLYKGHQMYCLIRNPEIQGAYVLCQYSHQVLLIKNSYRSYWTLPCGGVNKGESPLQAAVRELREEVGLHIQPQDLRFSAKILYEGENKRDHIHIFSHQFSRKPSVQIDNMEVEEYQWVNKENVQQYTLFAPIIPYVFSALNM